MKKISFIILIYSCNFYSQTSVLPLFDNTSTKIYQGFSEAFEWYDIPVVTYLFSKNHYFIPENKSIITIPPFEFDEEVQESVGKTGRGSTGGMDHNTIPLVILGGRGVFTLAENIISPGSVSKDDYKRMFLFYKSVIYTHAITELTKNLISRERPDKSDARSFFSGHSSVTFAAASFLYRDIDHYLDKWYPSSEDNTLRTGLKVASFTILYGWAGYVAYSRVYDNKHYLSDVVIGAAAGILVSNFVYNLYLKDDTSILNSFSLGYINRAPSVSFYLNF